MWRAYGIGPGKFYSADQLARFGTPQDPTRLEEGCIKVFKAFAALQKHLDIGEHMLRLAKESACDEIKKK
ncbi:hypothetical protein pdam_00025891 [Pocillopora damicornis]|uniref:Uncharacterized protein n=1 Tax=Pocillopora damicornis TaxID=46731 RepID=A0A3M6UJ80_POCDA|nr:hypothetical protein pdam_00025891 [Pocillopora damicornis]